MNLEQVAHFTEFPQQLKLEHAAELKKLTGNYPFSSVYSLLYLTALANGKSPDLDSALQEHAYRLNDRTKLYHLLTGRMAMDVNSEESVVDSPEQENNEVATVTEQELPEIPEDAVSEPVLSPEIDAIAPEILPVPEEGPETAAEEEEPDFTLDTEAFKEITNAFTLEQNFVVDSQEPVVGSQEPEVSSPEPEALVSQTEDVSPEEISAAEKAIPETSISSEITGRKSFTSWLHSSQDSAPSRPEEPKKPEANSLIDKFIEQEPRISRGKTDFYSPSRKAKESLNEDAVPVSETLAKIYAAQGNYPKAIHVYHQLMLSFPEKKSLFAVQIEELKKKITP